MCKHESKRPLGCETTIVAGAAAENEVAEFPERDEIPWPLLCAPPQDDMIEHLDL